MVVVVLDTRKKDAWDRKKMDKDMTSDGRYMVRGMIDRCAWYYERRHEGAEKRKPEEQIDKTMDRKGR